MSKTETMRQLNAAATAQRLKQSGQPPAAGSPAAQSGSPAIDHLSAAVRELITQLPSWQSQMAAWPEVVSARVAAALRTAQQQAAAQQTTEALTLTQERAAWVRETTEALNSLKDTERRMNNLVAVQEQQQAARVWGWSRDQWIGVAFGVAFSVLLGLGGGMFSREFGPPSQAWTQAMERRAALEAELSDYRRKWEAVRPAAQKKIEQRLADKQAGT